MQIEVSEENIKLVEELRASSIRGVKRYEEHSVEWLVNRAVAKYVFTRLEQAKYEGWRSRQARKRLSYQGYMCPYCTMPLSYKTMTIDHIIPKKRGGSIFDPNNFVMVHEECNMLKNHMQYETWIDFQNSVSLRDPNPTLQAVGSTSTGLPAPDPTQ